MSILPDYSGVDGEPVIQKNFIYSLMYLCRTSGVDKSPEDPFNKHKPLGGGGDPRGLTLVRASQILILKSEQSA